MVPYILIDFFFSLDNLYEYPYEYMLTLDSLISLVKSVRAQYKPKQSASKKILAENIINPNLTQTFSSIG